MGMEANLDAQALPSVLNERLLDEAAEQPDVNEPSVSRWPQRASFALMVVVQLVWMIGLVGGPGYGLYRIALQLPIFNP